MSTDEVHLGDIGTKYWVKVTDAGLPFNPSAATTKELIFKLPSGTVVKTGVAEQVGADWFLTHVVTDGTFHSATGKVSVQAKIVFADGQVYRSQIQTKDKDGDELRIYSNIELP